MQIQPGVRIELELELLGEDGEVLDSWDTDEPLEVVHGEGDLPEALEKALEGAANGAEVDLLLDPDDAFGPYDPDCVIAVPKEQFEDGTDLEIGEHVQISVDEENGEDPEELDARIVELDGTTVFLDANHPLAGRKVRFKARVLAVHGE